MEKFEIIELKYLKNLLEKELLDTRLTTEAIDKIDKLTILKNKLKETIKWKEIKEGNVQS